MEKIMECRYCIDELPVRVVISDIETKCKYHMCTGAVYESSALAPRGMCRELFYAAYAPSLAVLYNGKPRRWNLRTKGVEELTASCPHPQGIRVCIRSQEILPAPIRILKEICEELLKIIFRPLDGHFRRVGIEVIQGSPHCPKAYKKGDTFQFNTNKRDELCPAGFAAIYPYVRILKSAKDRGSSSGTMKIHCPDHVGVTYEIQV
ncbi:MAG: TIGR04076 family protein [bacterium]